MIARLRCLFCDNFATKNQALAIQQFEKIV
jgi:hypothetical protein